MEFLKKLFIVSFIFVGATTSAHDNITISRFETTSQENINIEKDLVSIYAKIQSLENINRIILNKLDIIERYLAKTDKILDVLDVRELLPYEDVPLDTTSLTEDHKERGFLK